MYKRFFSTQQGLAILNNNATLPFLRFPPHAFVHQLRRRDYPLYMKCLKEAKKRNDAPAPQPVSKPTKKKKKSSSSSTSSSSATAATTSNAPSKKSKSSSGKKSSSSSSSSKGAVALPSPESSSSSDESYWEEEVRVWAPLSVISFDIYLTPPPPPPFNSTDNGLRR